MPGQPTCERCKGDGTIPHEKRMLDAGTEQARPDPFDHQVVEICDVCGGGGVKLPHDAHAANRAAAKALES